MDFLYKALTLRGFSSSRCKSMCLVFIIVLSIRPLFIKEQAHGACINHGVDFLSHVLCLL